MRARGVKISHAPQNVDHAPHERLANDKEGYFRPSFNEKLSEF
jgi:hypothetical protein